MKKPEKKSLLDLNHPFFDPLWKRIVTTAVLFGWSAFEYSNDAVVWSLIFALLGLYAAYHFFLVPRDTGNS